MSRENQDSTGEGSGDVPVTRLFAVCPSGSLTRGWTCGKTCEAGDSWVRKPGVGNPFPREEKLFISTGGGGKKG